MLSKRIIPCLDIDGGRVVKGIKFVNIRDAGDPVESGAFYDSEGADELVFLDITASSDKRNTVAKLAERVSEKVFIPFTIGGGIRTVDDFRMILTRGADKVSINSQAVRRPELISEAAARFGRQCVVVAIDAKRNGRGSFDVYLDGGRRKTDLDAIEWASRAEKLGAGEILLTSMDRDGTREGYDLELTKKISEKLNIPVIASGGAGSMQDFAAVLKNASASAALAASLFHFREIKIAELKEYLSSEGVEIRN
jgi:cyclase